MTHYTAEDLILADRHIAEGEMHLVRQEVLFTDLEARGQPTETAQELLGHFRDSLAEHRIHRAAIAAALEGDASGQA
jgi:hypothetical protein